MPSGKELEQLPLSNVAPSTGKDMGQYDRKSLDGVVKPVQPEPADIEKENEDMI
ncbi:MAG: hypothetical protein Q8934_10150 [Bacillota bacterium]|nr:hypothetical protein [Bacillota bacterium]